MDQAVKDYLDRVPPKWRSHVETLHAAILECYPDATVDLRYRMPTYTRGEGWVAIASQKSYVSLYTCGAQHLERFTSAYPDYRTGKGCINFRLRDEIPEAAVKEVVRHAIEHPKGDAGARNAERGD